MYNDTTGFIVSQRITKKDLSFFDKVKLDNSKHSNNKGDYAYPDFIHFLKGGNIKFYFSKSDAIEG